MNKSDLKLRQKVRDVDCHIFADFYCWRWNWEFQTGFPKVTTLNFQKLWKPTPFVGKSHGQHYLQRISNRVCIEKIRKVRKLSKKKRCMSSYLDAEEPFRRLFAEVNIKDEQLEWWGRLVERRLSVAKRRAMLKSLGRPSSWEPLWIFWRRPEL